MATRPAGTVTFLFADIEALMGFQAHQSFWRKPKKVISAFSHSEAPDYCHKRIVFEREGF